MLNLDPPEIKDEPVSASATTWTMTDRYSGTTLTFKSDGEGTCHVTMTHNNDDVVTVNLTIEATDEDVTNLGKQFVTPLLERIEREDAAALAESAARAEIRNSEERLRPFILITKGMGGGTLHRVGCPVVKASVVGLQYAEHADRMIDAVRIALGRIVTDPNIIAQRTNRNNGYSRPRIVSTVKFCGTCRPLGDPSGAISSQVSTLANTSVADGGEQTRLEALARRIEALMWEVSREHVDNVQGRGGVDG